MFLKNRQRRDGVFKKTQFNIDFLLPLTSSRKVPGKETV